MKVKSIYKYKLSHFTEIITLADETGDQLCFIPTRCFVPTWYFDSVLVMPRLNTAILDQIMVPHIRYPNDVGLSWILLHFSASEEFLSWWPIVIVFSKWTAQFAKRTVFIHRRLIGKNLLARLLWHQQKHSISWIVHLWRKKGVAISHLWRGVNSQMNLKFEWLG